MMGPRQWLDALSYCGPANAVLWTAHGLIAGLVCAVVVILSRRARSGIVPGAWGVSVFVAGAGSLWFWAWAVDAHVKLASRISGPWWWILLAGVWLLLLLAAYAVCHHLSALAPARRLGEIARAGVLPSGLLVAVGLAFQIYERPQRLETDDAVPSLAPSEAAEPAPQRRPNIVLIVLDTQRADRMGCYGYERETSPRMDAFAREATLYERCISPAIWTVPSHASMLTGLYPSEHGATWDHMWLDDRFPTITERLGEAGYQTFGLSNNLYVGLVTNLGRGFDGLLHPIMLHDVRGGLIGKIVIGALYPSHLMFRWLGVLTAQDDGAKATNQIARKFFRLRDPNRPFFLFVNYLEPHAPYVPHMTYKRAFVEPDQMEASFRCAWWVRRPEYSLLRQDYFPAEEMELLSDVYDAETRQLDDFVGDLLEELAGRVDLEDTLVMITSDHGELLGEHHIIGHAWTVCDTLAHVPLIVRYPKRLPAGRRSEVVQTLDLYATMLDAAGLLSSAGPLPHSRSLLAGSSSQEASAAASTSRAASTSAPSSRPIVTEYLAGHDEILDMAQKIDNRFDRTPYERPIRGIRDGRWKYVRHECGPEALYDLQSDPAETTNVIDAHRDVAQRLARQLAAWQRSIRRYEPVDLDGSQKQMDDELRSRLRALGYVQ